jgi:hypothetical protein
VEDCGIGEFPFQVVYQVCREESKKGRAQPASGFGDFQWKSPFDTWDYRNEEWTLEKKGMERRAVFFCSIATAISKRLLSWSLVHPFCFFELNSALIMMILFIPASLRRQPGEEGVIHDGAGLSRSSLRPVTHSLDQDRTENVLVQQVLCFPLSLFFSPFFPHKTRNAFCHMK